MSAPKLLPPADFLKLFADHKAFERLEHNSSTTVTGDIHINGKEVSIGQDRQFRQKGDKSINLHLRNITFNGLVFVQNLENLCLLIDGCHFMESLHIEVCSGSYLNISSCTLKNFGGYHNRFERLAFEKIEGQPSGSPHWNNDPVIDISGFDLSKELKLEEVTAKELRLSDSSDRFKTPWAVVDDPLWALQLQLAGIHLDVGTEIARQMLQPGSFAERVSAGAA